MRLHRLEITAFGPYAGSEVVDFDALAEHGIFLLTGPTGAGKTSVLDAISFALFGAVPGARQSAKRLRSDHADIATRTCVVLEATIRGQRLRITRTPDQERPKQRGTGTTTAKATATLEQRVDDGWRCLSTRLDEVGDQIGQLLGMSRDQFCQVVLLPQGDFATFLRSDAEHRRELLQRLFATERFEQVEKKLREWRSATEAEASAARAELHETLARLAEAAGEFERPEGIDVVAWADDLRDGADKRLLAVTGEASAVRMSAQRTRDRHKAAEELAALQQQHADAQRRKVALEARRPDVVLAEHELDAARRAGTVVPLLSASLAAAAAHASAVASLITARDGLAAEPDPGPALATSSAQALKKSVAMIREECGELTAALDLERAALKRVADAATHDATATEAADRMRTDQVWLSEFDAAKAARDQQLQLARERAALVGPCREAVRLATERAIAAKLRDDLVVRHGEQCTRVAVLVDRAQEARQRWLDLREERINGIASELAEDLIPGEPCPVCGSDAHPAPATAAPSAVTTADEIAADDEWNTADQERRLAEEALREIDTELAAARATAGGDTALTTLQAALTDARGRLAEAEESAAGIDVLAAALREFEAERGEHERQKTEWAKRCEAARTAAEEARAFVAEAAENLAVARGTDPSVAARAQRLGALAETAETVLQAERDAADARRGLDAAHAAAEQAARDAGFTNVDDAADAARDAARIRMLTDLLAEFQAEAAKVAEHLDNPALATAAAAPPVDVASALVELEEIETQLRALDGALGTAQTAVRSIDRLHGRLMQQVAALQPLDARCSLITRLCELANGVGSDNDRRMTLSAYVLAARLEQVAAAATTRLLQMSGGRYSLVHTDERDAHNRKSGLGLAVIDGWTGQQRPTATLSGGESFFASLALALGLADVAAAEAGGTRLETLFVDEGFGSLDDETLDEVMTVLDSLRDGGRVIGIVSHVADLRQRIPAQLAVSKSASGSTLARAGDHANV